MASTSSLPAPDITLYWLDTSRSQRIAWLLEELGLPYRIEVFRRNRDTRQAPPELERIHPLGKSPVLTIRPVDSTAEPTVLAESNFIAQYLCDHFAAGKGLTPDKWKPGEEGAICGETETWMRYQYLIQFGEGTFMPHLMVGLALSSLSSPRVPFFLRPITSAVGNRLIASFVLPNARKDLRLIDQMLATAPGVAKADANANVASPAFLCGPQLTAADILLSFPLLMSKQGLGRLDAYGNFWNGGSVEQEFPRVWAYLDRLEATEGWKRAEERAKQADTDADEHTQIKAKH